MSAFPRLALGRNTSPTRPDLPLDWTTGHSILAIERKPG